MARKGRKGRSRARAVVRYVSRTPQRVGQAARRGATVAARVAAEEKHLLVAVGAGALLGLLKKKGVTLPSIPMLGQSGTLGVAAFIGARITKNRVLRHLATGFLTIAAYELTSAGKIAGPAGGVFGMEDFDGPEVSGML